MDRQSTSMSNLIRRRNCDHSQDSSDDGTRGGRSTDTPSVSQSRSAPTIRTVFLSADTLVRQSPNWLVDSNWPTWLDSNRRRHCRPVLMPYSILVWLYSQQDIFQRWRVGRAFSWQPYALYKSADMSSLTSLTSRRCHSLGFVVPTQSLITVAQFVHISGAFERSIGKTRVIRKDFVFLLRGQFQSNVIRCNGAWSFLSTAKYQRYSDSHWLVLK